MTNAVTITEITLAIPRRVAARQDPRRDRDDSRCAVRARAAAAAGRRWRLLRRPAGSPGDRAARARSTGDLEAIAVAAKLNAEGGGKLLRFTTRASHSRLHERLELERSQLPPLNAFFLRAESVFNLATAIEEGGPIGACEDVYERPLHEQSHGESFLDIAVNRLGPRGFYLFDEPEAALSVRGQLALIRRMHELVRQHSQFVIATHSPILLGYPDATILELADDGIRRVDYEDTQQVELTRSFLDDPQRFLRHLLAD